ncbi:hypothetical protein [Pontixanthobacter sp.]|uniref:hypothetical protein n=1 Tax=Pontixanthobacter sp. TaxID=2792078 RepID=UPI003C7CE7A8
MGLAILFAIGSILGWLSSIIFSADTSRAVLIDVVSGALGALVLGMALTTNSLLEEISANTFLFGCIGAVAGLAAAHAVRRMSIG